MQQIVMLGIFFQYFFVGERFHHSFNSNETLTDKQSEMLEKYDAAVNEMHSLSEVEAFSYGFRLGVRFMIEAVVIKEIP